MKEIVFIFFLFCWINGSSQSISSFKSLRYDEDYSFFEKDTTSKGWYHGIKFTPLSHNKIVYISFGGDIRYQYFYIKSEDWGDAPEDNNGYILTRYLVHADFHAGRYFRTFVQFQSSLSNGKETVPSPVDENQLDIHQAFFDIALPSDSHSIIVRVGRQELLYGSQRLIALRDGPNNRQSFDAARLIYSQRNLKADLFFSHYVRSKQQIFDDGFNKNTNFWGGYVVINKIPVLQNIDLYYLGLWKSSASFDDGKARELRYSIGTRVWKKTANWQYDFEGLYQWGKFGTEKISGWTLSSNTTYTINSLKRRLQINLKTELISGDKNYNDNKLNTFNPLFPRGAYFGLAALIGPVNLMDIHPSLLLSLTRKLDLTFDYDAFWRYSRNDGIYGPNVALIYSGKNIAYKFIGQQFSTYLIYTPNNFLYLRGEFTWFEAGKYLKKAGTGKNIVFTGVTAQLKF
jgi:Alginate export